MAQSGLKRYPSQIKYIVGNEACERFSYYGMRSILVVFMVHYLAESESNAKGVYHTFQSAVYFLPLLGGFISDRFWGKYKTIIWLSLVYCLGHLVLALWDNINGLYMGLALIALGSGGIKPCVSAHVGDQFNETNKHLINKVFEIFYWAINFGSFFSTLMIPKILTLYGPNVAFGIPGILMLLATVIFWMGRTQYIYVPPTGKQGGSKFFSIVTYAIMNIKKRAEAEDLLDVALAKYDSGRVEGAKAVLGVFKVFIWVAAFWALFDQQGSSFILQAQKMDRVLFGMTIEAAQTHALNPILVLILIPLFSLGIYPAIQSKGIQVTPLRKMSAGMVLAAVSFLTIGWIQQQIDSGRTLSVAWQFIPILLITIAEVMVSITGLEFAYTQAPRTMKSTIMSFWLLTITFGNFLAATVSYMNPFQGAGEFYFYAGMMAVVSIIFILNAIPYREKSFVESILSPAPA